MGSLSTAVVVESGRPLALELLTYEGLLFAEAEMEERDARDGLVDTSLDFVSFLLMERGEDPRCEEEAE